VLSGACCFLEMSSCGGRLRHAVAEGVATRGPPETQLVGTRSRARTTIGDCGTADALVETLRDEWHEQPQRSRMCMQQGVHSSLAGILEYTRFSITNRLES
jgi:hypothetical protein